MAEAIVQPISGFRLTAALRSILARTHPENPADHAQPLTLGLVVETTGERAFGVLMAFLCLPFLLPFTIPGTSGPFGIALMLLGVQLMVRKHRPWLPHRMMTWKLPQKFGTKLIGGVVKLFAPLEKVVRPRLLFMQNALSMVIVGIALVIDGFLLALPWPPIIPLSNTAPAWIALVKILGITESDGLMLILGVILTAAAVVAAVVVAVIGWSWIVSWWR